MARAGRWRSRRVAWVGRERWLIWSLIVLATGTGLAVGLPAFTGFPPAEHAGDIGMDSLLRGEPEPAREWLGVATGRARDAFANRALPVSAAELRAGALAFPAAGALVGSSRAGRYLQLLERAIAEDRSPRAPQYGDLTDGALGPAVRRALVELLGMPAIGQLARRITGTSLAVASGAQTQQLTPPLRAPDRWFRDAAERRMRQVFAFVRDQIAQIQTPLGRPARPGRILWETLLDGVATLPEANRLLAALIEATAPVETVELVWPERAGGVATGGHRRVLLALREGDVGAPGGRLYVFDLHAGMPWLDGNGRLLDWFALASGRASIIAGMAGMAGMAAVVPTEAALGGAHLEGTGTALASTPLGAYLRGRGLAVDLEPGPSALEVAVRRLADRVPREVRSLQADTAGDVGDASLLELAIAGALVGGGLPEGVGVSPGVLREVGRERAGRFPLDWRGVGFRGRWELADRLRDQVLLATGVVDQPRPGGGPLQEALASQLRQVDWGMRGKMYARGRGIDAVETYVDRQRDGTINGRALWDVMDGRGAPFPLDAIEALRRAGRLETAARAELWPIGLPIAPSLGLGLGAVADGASRAMAVARELRARVVVAWHAEIGAAAAAMATGDWEGALVDIDAANVRQQRAGDPRLYLPPGDRVIARASLLGWWRARCAQAIRLSSSAQRRTNGRAGQERRAEASGAGGIAGQAPRELAQMLEAWWMPPRALAAGDLAAE